MPSRNRAQLERLRFIDFMLEHHGTIRRHMIMDYFGLSMPQASHDIQAYIDMAPNNIAYDRSLRIYMRTSTFARALP